LSGWWLYYIFFLLSRRYNPKESKRIRRRKNVRCTNQALIVTLFGLLGFCGWTACDRVTVRFRWDFDFNIFRDTRFRWNYDRSPTLKLRSFLFIKKMFLKHAIAQNKLSRNIFDLFSAVGRSGSHHSELSYNGHDHFTVIPFSY
jgi:hypothetical protein